MIEAIENVGRCQRSDHIKKAINYVKILLEKQAEPNARDEWGSGSALHYAIWCGQLEVVKLLLDTDACNIEADTGTAHSNHPFRCCILVQNVADCTSQSRSFQLMSSGYFVSLHSARLLLVLQFNY